MFILITSIAFANPSNEMLEFYAEHASELDLDALGDCATLLRMKLEVAKTAKEAHEALNEHGSYMVRACEVKPLIKWLDTLEPTSEERLRMLRHLYVLDTPDVDGPRRESCLALDEQYELFQEPGPNKSCNDGYQYGPGQTCYEQNWYNLSCGTRGHYNGK